MNQKFLAKNSLHKVTKGLLQDIDNAKGIDKKQTNIFPIRGARKQQLL